MIAPSKSIKNNYRDKSIVDDYERVEIRKELFVHLDRATGIVKFDNSNFHLGEVTVDHWKNKNESKINEHINSQSREEQEKDNKRKPLQRKRRESDSEQQDSLLQKKRQGKDRGKGLT